MNNIRLLTIRNLLTAMNKPHKDLTRTELSDMIHRYIPILKPTDAEVHVMLQQLKGWN